MEKMETNESRFERELAWARATLTKAPAKDQLSAADYARLRSFLLEHDIMKGVQQVLDAGVRNLMHERADRSEYALAINQV